MKKALVFGSLLVLLVGVSGCGASADSLLKDQIKALNDLADALEKNEPENKVTEIKTRLEEIGKQMEKLKLSDEEKKKLVEKHKEELANVIPRLQKAMLSKAMKDFGGQFPGMPKFGNLP